MDSYPKVTYYPPTDDSEGRSRWTTEDGTLHRDGAPAIIYDDGMKVWVRMGDWHREDGPAVERPNGDNDWWLEGYKVSWDDETGWEFVSMPQAQKGFVINRIRHVGTGKTWETWQDLFTSAREASAPKKQKTTATPVLRANSKKRRNP